MRNPNCASGGSDSSFKPRRLRRATAVLAAAVALQWAGFATAATTDNWTAVGSGFWNTAANWTNASGGHIFPAVSDVVNIVSGGLIARTVTVTLLRHVSQPCSE